MTTLIATLEPAGAAAGRALPAACHLCPPRPPDTALGPDPHARVLARDPHVAEKALVSPAGGPSSATTFA
jgi:hypothetical protein